MENYSELKKYLDESSEAEQEQAKGEYESFRSQLPLQARIPSVSTGAYISDVTAGCTIELAKVAYATAENIREVLQASEKKHISIYPFINLRNYEFHASATFLNPYYGVFALNAGVFFAITDICSSVIHRAEFLSDLLPVSKELTVCSCIKCGGTRSFNGWLTDYCWLAADQPDKAPAWRPMIASGRPTPRAVVGGFLVLRCLFWICAHEIGHLLLDHLSILDRKTYSENESELFEGEKLQRHVMEIEADMFATCIDVDIRRAQADLEERIAHAKKDASYKGSWPEPTEELVARVLAVVPFIIGVILAHVGNRATNTHPLPKHRYLYSSHVFEQLLKGRGLEKLVPDRSRLFEDYAAVIAVCVGSEQLMEDFWLGGTEEEFEKLVKEVNKFEESHGAWADRLLKYGLFQRYENS